MDFNVIKFFLVLILVLHQAELKLILMELLWDILVLLLVEVFSVEVWENLFELSIRFLKFRLVWLLSFMRLFMLWRKLKWWSLLMYGWNVIMLWFLLHLLLRLMSHCMLRNRWNTCLNYCGKIRFKVTHIFRKENASADKLTNLWFIHRESFHLYNRLPSNLFLEFFINKYSLPMYHFC